MMEWLTQTWDHVGVFFLEGYIFVTHFVASAVSTVTRSAHPTAKSIGNIVRKVIDFLALNIGKARNSDLDEELVARLKAEVARVRKHASEAFERNTALNKEIIALNNKRIDLKSKISRLEVALRKEQINGRTNPPPKSI